MNLLPDFFAETNKLLNSFLVNFPGNSKLKSLDLNEYLDLEFVLVFENLPLLIISSLHLNIKQPIKVNGDLSRKSSEY